jgi:hypothetical protein
MKGIKNEKRRFSKRKTTKIECGTKHEKVEFAKGRSEWEGMEFKGTEGPATLSLSVSSHALTVLEARAKRIRGHILNYRFFQPIVSMNGGLGSHSLQDGARAKIDDETVFPICHEVGHHSVETGR